MGYTGRRPLRRVRAIGRLGNWFNQELFGRPTTLPWGLHIDPSHRPAGLERISTYHPTFLYEALWNLGYGLGRLWVEALRIDAASTLVGVRVNIWVSLLTILGAAAWLVRGRRRRSDPEAQFEGLHTAAQGPP